MLVGSWGVLRSVGICCWNRLCGSSRWVAVGESVCAGYEWSCGGEVGVASKVSSWRWGECVEVSMAEGGSTCGVV